MTPPSPLPAHLAGYAAEYAQSPRTASLAWFADARFGMFIHYGLYSALGRGEWVMHAERIPVGTYERLADDFTAAEFDADAIAELAEAAGMRYVTITTKHHDGFCLWDSAQTDFTSMRVAGRDLVAELAEACRRRGLGIFLYYSYPADWRHPYAPENSIGVDYARPEYDEPDPAYLGSSEAEIERYLDFVHAQLTELLTDYGDVAGIWLDLVGIYYTRPDLFPVDRSYALIRELQPHALISYKQGATGAEDYMSQEISFVPLRAKYERSGFAPEMIARSDEAWDRNLAKWNEVCTMLQRRGWGYLDGAEQRGPDEVLQLLATAHARRCNLLLNVAPYGSGALQRVEVETLREVGRRLDTDGWPTLTTEVADEVADTGAGAE